MGGRDGELNKFILKLLHFVLTHNFFIFKDQFYLQQRGTAMGADCAPSYANLFLGMWERLVFGEGGGRLSSHVQCWLRYIDDVLFFWQGTVEQLDEFMGHLNSNNLNIKLTYKHSSRCIDFLDINIEVDQSSTIQTSVHRKSTSVNALLHASSAHTPSTIRAIPTGQFLRTRRICSSDAVFESQSADLRGRFRDRGYSNRCIRRGYLRAKRTPRQQLLNYIPKYQQSDPPVRFIGTHNSHWQTVREILKKHWPVLRSDPILAELLPPGPLMTARRSKNLRDILLIFGADRSRDMLKLYPMYRMKTSDIATWQLEDWDEDIPFPIEHALFSIYMHVHAASLLFLFLVPSTSGIYLCVAP
ncbi:uncharacterized protein ACNLHF_016540 isoform 1-T1 [Anomaloglossus baeobatrachus]|uniref:uncharacterized protein LOC142310639 n=1 Tax=Anomaloglossus baeobatrachus TaxID=238106 RepID=UPI003F50AC3E